MLVIKGLKNLRTIKNSALTIGVFDGVHVGHRKIISEAVEAARTMGIPSVAITFDPHPMKVTDPARAVPSLISLKHRAKLIEKIGVDYLVILKFTRSFSKIPPERFVRDILVKKLGAKAVYVGEDFRFGSGGKAGTEILKKISRGLGIKVKVLKPVKVARATVSSSLIRDLISKGKLKEAGALLGRPVAVLGTVVAGSGLGRHLGYPTANVNPHHEAIPPTGVYAVMVAFGGKLYKGVLNIGTAPTFFSPRDKEPAIEAHIFNFKGNLYGKDIEVLFIKRIRQERKFKVISDLIEQIRKDEKKALQILNAVLTY